ncbi:hypothetical protein, conserved [Angomonas deanei]|uniref:Replication factor-A C terminal domain containing protein n=1 Tax=Angomonas deanei TaxID=59799 RepID=A0A7G2C5K8_9TRYP|nr:hypothetical protein, conserved [Angomonas deanei]
MNALTVGFCESAVFGSFTQIELEKWKSQWVDPCLQIIDIQRYQYESSEQQCFYVAASDSKSLVWLVVPPLTALEEMISTYQLEIGCCIVLKEYTILSSGNGLNVIIPLNITFSPNPLSLIGNSADLSSPLFHLSDMSLCWRTERQQTTQSHNTTVEVTLADLQRDPQCVLKPWSMEGRVVWKGKGHRMQDNVGSFKRSFTSARFVLMVTVVDCNGDAIDCDLWSPSPLEDTVEKGNCVRLTGGNVVWSNTGVPLKFNFSVKEGNASSFVVENNPNLPLHVVRFPFENEVLSVLHLLHTSSVEDVVCFSGVVRQRLPGSYVNTKRGRVLKSSVVVSDLEEPSVTIEVTVWGDLVELVEPATGERWLFRNCTVKEFMGRKTVSTRSNTMAVKVVEASENVYHVTSAAPPVVPEEPKTRDVEVSLNLLECTETLPCIARIQQMDFSSTTFTCRDCDATIEEVRVSCPHCLCEAVQGVLSCRVVLSDGVSSVEATVGPTVTELLMDMTQNVFFENIKRQPHFLSTLSALLVGTPILVWMLSLPGGEVVVTNCKHVNLSVCSAYILGAIHSLIESA